MLPACAAAAAQTSRVRIAAGRISLPLHQPLRVAEDAATLDGLSGGRMEIGIAFDRTAWDQAGDRLEEEISLLRRAWSEHPIDLHSRYRDYADVDVHPKPIQSAGPPIWLECLEANPLPLHPNTTGDATENTLEHWEERIARLELGLLVERLDPSFGYPLGSGKGRTSRRERVVPQRVALRLPWLLVGEPIATPGVGAALRTLTLANACRELEQIIQQIPGVTELDVLLPGWAPGPSQESWEHSAELFAGPLREALAARRDSLNR